MFYKYFCSRCQEEFEIEHGAGEDPKNFVEEFLDCFDCDGEYLQKIGQIKQRKEMMRMRKNEGY